MSTERDCNTCKLHKQEQLAGLGAFFFNVATHLICEECLSRPEELPHYEPDEETMRA